MKILFIAPYAPSLIRVRPFQFLKELTRRHEVTLLVTDHQRMLKDLPALAEELSVSGGGAFQAIGVPLQRPDMIRSSLRALVVGDPLQGLVCQSPRLNAALERLLHQQSFDVVHIEHLRAARLVDALPEQLPRVYDAVDSISLLLQRTLQSSHDVRQKVVAAVELRRTRRFEGQILGRFDRVAVTSPDDARTLSSLSPTVSSRLAVVPNGVDLKYFRPIEGQAEPATVVLSGKMSYHANATAVLFFAREVLPLIHKQRPEVRFRVVGSQPTAAVRALSADPRVEVTGQVPDLRRAIGTATVAVCPVTVKVGIQNKILEAMSLGVPVVSSAAGTEGLEAVAGRDLLVGVDAPTMAAHVLELLDRPDRRRSISEAGRAYVQQRHRWDDMTRRLEDAYEDARETRGAAGRSPT